MAQLTFLIATDELRVDVRINLSAPDLAATHTAGRSAPASVLRRAILDTGSNVTGVASSILRQLSLIPVLQSSTQGVGGQIPVDLYRVSLSIFDATKPHLPWFVQPDLLVMELPPTVSFDVLIGMDVLLDCRMLLDGPGRQFTLDF